jgi:hypothetical protein
VTTCIIDANFDKADVEKKKIEEKHRKIRETKEEKNEKHIPKYFEYKNNSWVYKNKIKIE